MCTYFPLSYCPESIPMRAFDDIALSLVSVSSLTNLEPIFLKLGIYLFFFSFNILGIEIQVEIMFAERYRTRNVSLSIQLSVFYSDPSGRFYVTKTFRYRLWANGTSWKYWNTGWIPRNPWAVRTSLTLVQSWGWGSRCGSMLHWNYYGARSPETWNTPSEYQISPEERAYGGLWPRRTVKFDLLSYISTLNYN